jgi:ethanolamine utilization microcompartment shell protein EutL
VNLFNDSPSNIGGALGIIPREREDMIYFSLRRTGKEALVSIAFAVSLFSGAHFGSLPAAHWISNILLSECILLWHSEGEFVS